MKNKTVLLISMILISALIFSTNFSWASQKDNTLVVAVSKTPPGIDIPINITSESHDATQSIYDVLIDYPMIEENGIYKQDFSHLVGYLAESWEISDDYKTVTFYLRKGVMSHNGNELTSEDVKWTFDRLFNNPGDGPFIFGAVLGMDLDDEEADDEAFKAIDKYTFSVTISKGNPVIVKALQMVSLGIYDYTEVKKHITDDDPWAIGWLSNHSAGFGPFMLEKWAPGQECTFVAHENYWQGAPKIKRVVMREVPNSAMRLSLLLGQSVDLAEFLTAREREKVKENPNTKVISSPGAAVMRLEMNAAVEPLNNILVRKAINYAIDKNDIINTVYYGKALLSKSFVPSSYPHYTDKYWKYDRDIEKAKELLKEAGYPDGFDIFLSYEAGITEEEEMAVIVQANLKDIGINATLDKLPGSTYIQRIMDDQLSLFFREDAYYVPDINYGAGLWLYSTSFTNHSNYNNPAVDKLVEEVRITFDEERRLEIAIEIQELVSDNPPWAFLVEPGYHHCALNNLTGFSNLTTGAIDWYYFDWE